MRKAPTRRNRGEYEVGWGKPPQATRWKPGQSGNPRGRPRGKKNQQAMFSDALDQKIRIEERGITRTITVREAIIKRFTALALKGDLKAIKLLLDLAPNPEPQLSSKDLDAMSPEEMERTYFETIKRVG